MVFMENVQRSFMAAPHIVWHERLSFRLSRLRLNQLVSYPLDMQQLVVYTIVLSVLEVFGESVCIAIQITGEGHDLCA